MMKNLPIKTIFWHFIVIILFIAYEMRAVFLVGSKAGILDHLILYILDISIFYLTSFWYLPLIQERVRNIILKGFFYAFWIFFFGCLFLGLTVFLESFHGKSMRIEDIPDRLFLFMWRRAFLFSIALGFWYARFSIEKEREIYLHQLQLVEARELNIKQENALLLAQVNPHLMFNALNGIYGMLAEKSPETAQIALLLSDMMASAIQEPQNGKGFTLGDELAQVERLIELHQMLNENQLQLDVNIEVPEEAKEIEFPPLLLVNVVDNIFKHGDLTGKEKSAKVSILYGNGFFHMVTSNYLPEYRSPRLRKGIGLENTRKRLDKHFSDNYDFNISSEQHEEFITHLIIKYPHELLHS